MADEPEPKVDGLPLDLDERRAAVAKQFESFEAAVKALDVPEPGAANAANAEMSEQDYDARVRRWQDRLIALAQAEGTYPGCVDVILDGTARQLDVWRQVAVLHVPASLPVLLSKLDAARERLRLVGEAAAQDATAVRH